MLQVFIGAIVIVFLGLFVLMSLPMMREGRYDQSNNSGSSSQNPSD